jgi:hypothetical protein
MLPTSNFSSNFSTNFNNTSTNKKGVTIPNICYWIWPWCAYLGF